MAEIKIEKKKPVWPWILVVLVILGIIAYVIYSNPDLNDRTDDFDDDITTSKVTDPDRGSMDNSTRSTYVPGTSYDQYAAYEGSIRDSTRIAKDSSYTKKAYYNLCKAVAKKAEDTKVENSQALTDLKDFSMLITKVSSPLSSAESAKNFKTASDKVTKVLEDIQIKSYPALQLQISDLKKVTSNMDGYIRMDQQQDNITQFLQKSREILKEMNK